MRNRGLVRKPSFHLNLSGKSIKDWIISQEIFVHFFDQGKGNVGPSGSSGLKIIDSDGAIVRKFPWNLGDATDSLAEYLVILQAAECLFTTIQIRWFVVPHVILCC